MKPSKPFFYVRIRSLTDRRCDTCGKPYDQHKTLEDRPGVYDICGWLVQPQPGARS